MYRKAYSTASVWTYCRNYVFVGVHITFISHKAWVEKLHKWKTVLDIPGSRRERGLLHIGLGHTGRQSDYCLCRWARLNTHFVYYKYTGDFLDVFRVSQANHFRLCAISSVMARQSMSYIFTRHSAGIRGFTVYFNLTHSQVNCFKIKP